MRLHISGPIHQIYGGIFCRVLSRAILPRAAFPVVLNLSQFLVDWVVHPRIPASAETEFGLWVFIRFAGQRPIASIATIVLKNLATSSSLSFLYAFVAL